MQPGVLPLRLGPYRAQRGRGRDDRRHVDEARHPAGLPLVGGQRRDVADALAHREHPDPGRSAPLVRAGGEQRPAGRQVHPPGALRGVHQQRHLAAERCHLGDRLHRADLVVGGLQHGERGVRPQRGGEDLRVHPAEPVDRHRGDLAALGEVPFGAVQHAGVLDGGVRQVPAAPPVAAQRAQHPEVDGLGPAGGEGDLVGPAADHLGHGLPGGVQQHSGPASGAVEPGGIGPSLVQRGGQRLPRDGVERCGGGHIEVHGHI